MAKDANNYGGEILLKRFLLVTFIFIFLITGCSVKNGIREIKGRTIEEVFSDPVRFHGAEIIYKEEIDKGCLVFYIPGTKTENYKLGAEYVWKSFGGWAASYYGGMHSYPPSEKLTSQYFPATKGSPFPMFYGEVLDSSIKKVVILDEKNGNEVRGKIISAGKVPSLNREVRIWYSLTDITPSSFTKVKGLDEAKKEVVTLETVHPPATTVRKQ